MWLAIRQPRLGTWVLKLSTGRYIRRKLNREAKGENENKATPDRHFYCNIDDKQTQCRAVCGRGNADWPGNAERSGGHAKCFSGAFSGAATWGEAAAKCCNRPLRR